MKRCVKNSDPRKVRRLRKRPLGRYRFVRLRWRVLFAAIDLIGAAAFGLCRAVRRAAPAPGAAERDRQPREDPKVILLVQLDHLGDAIISTVMLPPLRKRFPDASIEVLAGPWNREVFEALPQVDRVHVSRVNRFARGSLARFAWLPAAAWWAIKLRRRKIDLGIDLRGELPLALILWLCGARRRVGWACGGGGFLLTDVAEFVPDRPEIESRLALLAELEIRPQEGEPPWRPKFSAGRIATENAPAAASPQVVLHVGAGSRAKQWPAEYWQELLGRIIVETGAQVILVGGRKDVAIAQRVLDGRPWPGVIDRTGRLTIVELAALLKRADVFAGADSGPAHLAAAVDVPVVVLFSGTNNPQQWRPRGRRVEVLRRRVACSPCHRERCPRADHPCMKRLLPRRVAEAVKQMLVEQAGGRWKKSIARREGARG